MSYLLVNALKMLQKIPSLYTSNSFTCFQLISLREEYEAIKEKMKQDDLPKCSLEEFKSAFMSKNVIRVQFIDNVHFVICNYIEKLKIFVPEKANTKYFNMSYARIKLRIKYLLQFIGYQLLNTQEKKNLFLLGTEYKRALYSDPYLVNICNKVLLNIFMIYSEVYFILGLKIYTVTLLDFIEKNVARCVLEIKSKLDRHKKDRKGGESGFVLPKNITRLFYS